MASSMNEVVEKIYKKEFEAKTLPKKSSSRLRNLIRGIKKLLDENSFIKVGFLISWAIVFWSIVTIYNDFSRLHTICQAQYAEVGNELKRRSNLYPHLAGLMEQYLIHESDNFKYVSDARESLNRNKYDSSKLSKSKGIEKTRNSGKFKGLEDALKPGNMNGIEDALNKIKANEMGGSLSSLMALVESYPELKGNQPVQDLIKEMIATENRIADRKSRYNESAKQYNQTATCFPQNIICFVFRFPMTVDYISTNEETLKLPEMIRRDIKNE